MVAKGLNFPNVTLVGVIAADVSLNIPDFRSSERTFQLLSQVAGRAGRGQSPGRVVIQTFNPEHVAVRCAREHDYLAFYESALVERREAGYPPFRRLVNVLFTGEELGPVVTASMQAAERISQAEQEAEILGPVDCAIERLHGRWRRHLLLKLPAGANTERIGAALASFDPPGVQVIVDADPYSLM
jgi:primosomal protein N' (replication factor Y)